MDGAKGCLLGVGAAVVAAVVGVALLVAVVAGAQASCGGALNGAPQPAASQPTASADAQYSIPANYLALYQKAGRNYGIPWNVLAGIGEVETDHGRLKAPGVLSGENPWGAGGPMQFLQPTWDIYGVDGDGDGDKDRYDPADAIPAAANMLKHDGAPARMREAIFAYNHSWSYVDTVLKWAQRYAQGNYSIGANNNPLGSNCLAHAGASGAAGGPAVLGNANGALGERIVWWASKWLGTVYQWGGGDEGGPTVGQDSRGDQKKGFDCSGLVLYAVYQATNKRVDLPHYTGDQYNSSFGTPVSWDQLRPGDLMFFNTDAYLGHVGIYIGGGKMIHAPHTNDVVKISDLSGYYRSVFAGGRRVIGS